jgi:hypothetical protein
MEEKIGLLTFHRTTNFGSCLQTYGLYKKIVDLGYNCEVIDYRCPAIEARENRNTYKFDLNIKKLGRRLILQPALNAKAKSLDKFTHDRMKISKVYYPSNISETNGDYQKFLVGSDIVWGRDITEDDYNYFLEFVTDNSKKYAFASSVGNTDIRENEMKLEKLLFDFSRIAVRELDAVQWIEDIAHRDAEWVCDPTMLLTAQEWLSAVPVKKMAENYVLVYFNDPKKKAVDDAAKYAKKTHKKVVYINYGLPEKGVHNIKPKSLNEFLSWIYYADRVFTASYHGMLFSIYFEKEFLFYTRAHKSRVLSLAKRLGLLEQCGDKFQIENHKKIDYKIVGSRVEQFRAYSIQVLEEMLRT